MRRKDRMTDEKTAYKIFNDAPFVTVAFSGNAYCVPVSTAMLNGFVYFHCANEGTKLEKIKENANVCLSAVSYCKPTLDKFTTAFSSAIVFGTAELVENNSEKIDALRAISEKYTPENMQNFDAAIEKSLAVTTVVKVTIKEISGKQKIVKE